MFRVPGLRVPSRVFMLRTLFLASAAISLPLPASAQAPAATSEIRIASGPLTAALNRLASATGLQILYDAGLSNGRVSQGYSGPSNSENALRAVLAGTGLTYVFTGARTVTLSAPGTSEGFVGGDDAVMLDTIDVTTASGAAAAETARRDAPYQKPGSSAYISAEQVERFGNSTAGDVFKSTPGVIASGNHSGGASVDVNIRGMQGQSRVKVAIDGTQQSSTTWRGYLGVDERVYIDPDLIGGINIEKGPTGGAEGAGATGGVVGIRTLNAEDIVRDGETYGVRFKAGTSDNAIDPAARNTFDQRTDAPDLFDLENGSASIAAGATTENFDFIAAVARRKTGNYFAGERDPTALDGKRPNTAPGAEAFNTSEDSLSLLMKGTVRFGDDHTLKLGYTRFESDFGEAMGSLLFNNADYYRQLKLSSVATDTFTSNYRYDPVSELVDLRVNAWASHVDQDTRIAQAVPGNLEQWGYIPADDPRCAETWTYGGDVNNTSRIDTAFGGLVLNYGASYLLEDANGEAFCSRGFTRDSCFPIIVGGAVVLQPSVGTRDIGSLFSTGEWQATDWLKFNAGLRYDTYSLVDKGPEAVAGEDERDGGRLNPSISVTVEPIPGFQLYALYAEGLRPPTLRETMGSDGNVISNPDLDPEVQKNWEVGANYLKDGFLTDSDKVRLKGSYFVNHSENYISRVPSNAGPGQPVFTFDNLDRAMFSGFEASAQYDAGVFFSEAAVTYYSDYEFCRDSSNCGGTVQYDYAVNHIPPEIFVSVTAGLRFFDEKLVIGGRMIHASDRLVPVDSSDAQRTADWAPYTVYDAYASYELNDNVTLDIKAENLGDLYYIGAMDGWTPAPGRTIRASLTARF